MVTDEPQGRSNIHQNGKSMINICKIKNSRKNKIWSSDTRLMTRCCVRHEPKYQKALFLCFFCLIFNWFFCIKAGIFQLDFFIGIARTHCKEQKNRKKIQESCRGHAKKRFVEIKYFSEISFFSAGGRAFSCNMIWEISKNICEVPMCYRAQKEGVVMLFCNMYSMQVLMLTCSTEAVYCNTQRQTWLPLPMLNSLACGAKCSMDGNHLAHCRHSAWHQLLMSSMNCSTKMHHGKTYRSVPQHAV